MDDASLVADSDEYLEPGYDRQTPDGDNLLLDFARAEIELWTSWGASVDAEVGGDEEAGGLWVASGRRASSAIRCSGRGPLPRLPQARSCGNKPRYSLVARVLPICSTAHSQRQISGSTGSSPWDTRPAWFEFQDSRPILDLTRLGSR
jgi:hypothetical protein